MAWFLDVLGLGLGTLGALIMIQYPLAATRFTTEGSGEITFINNPSEHGRSEYRNYAFMSRLGVVLLAAGFALQFASRFYTTS